MRWPQVVFRGFQVLGHLTKHDLLSVDAILDKSVAPDILLSASHSLVLPGLCRLLASFDSVSCFLLLVLLSIRPAWILVFSSCLFRRANASFSCLRWRELAGSCTDRANRRSRADWVCPMWFGEVVGVPCSFHWQLVYHMLHCLASARR